MRRIPRTVQHTARVLACAALFLAPWGARTAAATALGNPKMEVLTAKITPPYSSTFNLSTAVSSWPPIADVTYLHEDQKNISGAIAVTRIFNPSSLLYNSGDALATDAGTFLSWAEMKDPFTYADHVGVFCFTQWSQSFRKDAADATMRFTITGAELYAMCLSTGARSEFAIDAWGYFGGTQFYSFHQDAGVKLTGNPPGVPTVTTVSHGPLGYTESNPDGINFDHELLVGTHTREIDLSGVPLGAEFTIVYSEMTQANIQFDEVVKALAYFRDPLDTSRGVVTEISGLTPTDNPQIPALAADPAAARASIRFSAARPNPARGRVSFTLELPATGEFRADVFDLSGRHVAELARGSYAAGVHTITWEPGDGPRGGVPAGVYFVRATGSGLDVVRRVVRIAGN